MLFEWEDEKDRINCRKHDMPLKAVKHSKKNPVDNSDIDFTKADQLTDEEMENRAKNDPDSLPFTDEELKHVKIKKRHQKDE
ncbi:hypothetical protein MNBD_GAMMA18-2107 [hydrothermal vent metagenome]|uniref:Uncharacterized protein n=1 Tax=hydrothermal vent metagenome TaxID=652676 RepID=A0A3B0ZZV0_9ZZZZ